MCRSPKFIIIVILAAIFVLTNCSSTRRRNIYGSEVQKQRVQATAKKGFQVYWREPPTGSKVHDVLFADWLDVPNFIFIQSGVKIPHKMQFMVEINGRKITQPNAATNNQSIANVITTDDGIINVTIYMSGEANIKINAENFSATIPIVAKKFRGQDSLIDVQFFIVR
jgi:hypothetical protein